MVAKKKVIIITSALLLAALGGGYALFSQPNDAGDQPISQVNPSNSPTNQPSATGAEESIEPPATQPTPNLSIDNISSGQELRAGDFIRGKALSPEGELYVSIKGYETGKVADYTVNIPSSRDEPQSYSIEVAFERPPQPGEKGILDIYTKEDGVRAYSKQVEIRLR